MFDLTHRTEADGSVVARAEIPCTLHLTSSDFGNDFMWVEVWKSSNTLGYALVPADFAAREALETVGGDENYRPLAVSTIDLDDWTKENGGELPPAFKEFMDKYGDTWESPYRTMLDGVCGYTPDKWGYLEESGLNTLTAQDPFHRDLTGAVAACESWRDDLERQLRDAVNECLGSSSRVWNVEIGDPVPDENNRWYDSGFHCTLWYETHVQA